MILAIKHLHMSLALISVLGFILRSIWLLCESPKFNARATKVLPHLIDTALLVSAITLLVLYGWNPLQQAWLLAKIFSLLTYIGLGICAFRLAKNKRQQALAACAALTCAGYLFAVAITKSPTLLLI